MELHVAALFFDEVPDAGVKFVAGEFEAGVAVLFEGAFVDDPSFEAGMVGTGDIPGGVAAETVVASKGIFEGDSEAVADVEITVSVRGRHDNGKTVTAVGFAGIDQRFFRLESAGTLPFGVDAWLEISRFVALCETHNIYYSIESGERGKGVLNWLD